MEEEATASSLIYQGFFISLGFIPLAVVCRVCDNYLKFYQGKKMMDTVGKYFKALR